MDFTVNSCCGLIFFTAIILFMGGKKPAFPPSLTIPLFLQTTSQVSDENKPSLCTLVLWCQLLSPSPW